MSGRKKPQRRTLEGDGVLLDRLNGCIGNDGLTALEDGRDADLLPLNGDLERDKKRVRKASKSRTFAAL